MGHHPLQIVLTTVNVPRVLYAYRDNIERHGHLEKVKIWIVGDVKTPAATADLAQDLTRQGLETVYLDIPAQEKWGRQCPDFYERLFFNNETRRNIGFLHALADGCQTLISIDDDISPGQDDFIGQHLQTGAWWPGGLIREPSGFYNICEHLKTDPDRLIYPRGFPFDLRHNVNAPLAETAPPAARIGVQLGLWTGAPDLDAVTWLNGPVESLARGEPTSHLLAQDTWTPINTQNMSLTRDLMPAFCCLPMGWELPGGPVGRYGDIWGGYLLQALLPGSNYQVGFGGPLVHHQRHDHAPLADLRHEYWGMLLTDWWINRFKQDFIPSQNDLLDRLVEASAFLREHLADLPPWCPQPVTDFLYWTADNIGHWAAACRIFL